MQCDVIRLSHQMVNEILWNQVQEIVSVSEFVSDNLMSMENP